MSGKTSIEALKKFIRKQGSTYLSLPNVTSVGIGYKVTGGKPTKNLSIQFTVARKISPEALGHAIPALPETIEVDGVQVPTDVIERSYQRNVREVDLNHTPDRKRAVNPIVPGVSIGHRNISAGTAGCVVYDAHTGAPYMLSNWHVLHGPDGTIGDPVVQPGRHDDNRVDRNVAGTLVRSHLGPPGDCAIASIDQRQMNPEIYGLKVAVESLGEPELGDKAVKSGRTTDITFGIVQRVHILASIEYGRAGIHQVGCFEIGPDPDKPAAEDEISRPGDSGAVWMAAGRGKATPVMLGLHFAGETGDDPDHALACYSASVFKKLEILPQPPGASSREETPPGTGYNIHFLGEPVDFPQAAGDEVQDDLVPSPDSGRIHYTHFSLAMSRSRQFCRWVAWNIDGGSLKRLGRRGLNFVKDPNIPAGFQTGNELYARNALDRGHLARRADLCWGPLPEAQRANKDSFFYTNITPQHEGFNQSSAGGIWGQLENAIFADAEVEGLKVSVIGGPVFQEDDREYRGVLIPRDFWKIIYYRTAGQSLLTAKAYRLTQKDLIHGLEAFELPEFAVYEVPVAQIAGISKLKLPVPGTPGQPGRNRRHVADTSGTVRVRRIQSIDEIVIGAS